MTPHNKMAPHTIFEFIRIFRFSDYVKIGILYGHLEEFGINPLAPILFGMITS
jgi:hypothetical protein